MQRIIGLDLVRAIAIFLVLVTHFVKKFEFFGLYGVELFFSLSGFLIGGILYRSLMSSPVWSFEHVKVFWLRRWWRTLPNYYLFLAVSFFFSLFFGGIPKLGDASKFLVFSQNLFTVPAGFYGVSWSLCVEEWFYFLFPLSIYVLTRFSGSKKYAFILATLPFLLIPPVLRELAFLNTSPDLVRQMTIPRLDAMFYGVAIAFFVSRFGISTQRRLLLFGFGLLTFIGLIAFQYSTENTIMFYRIAFIALPVAFSSMLPLTSLLTSFPAIFKSFERPVTNLSLWSYSIYLSHIPIMFTVYALFGDSRDAVWVNILSKIIGFVICIAVSRVVFIRFESKITSFRPTKIVLT